MGEGSARAYLKVLYFAGLRPSNPFRSLDDELKRIVDNLRLLERLVGAELSRPVRSSDNKSDSGPVPVGVRQVAGVGRDSLWQSLHAGGQNLIPVLRQLGQCGKHDKTD